ncbi:AAA family ATPase [Brachybacterium sp. FME24]|uniref:AAA family ATPase n=1 Tax=Brachybacterium sp. FME24 TaxID=2742605 RepID=UPI0018680A4B|nr:AAA family ATPase [Brachybacterium sp. FME24]
MLVELNLGNLAAYDSAARIADLAIINFIFGSNGSGKTSITKAIDTSDDQLGSTLKWLDPADTFEACIYNREYVTSILHSSTTIPGVFALGGDSARALERIDQLSSENGEIAKAEKKVEGLRGSLSGTDKKPGPETRLNAARTTFDEDAWKVRQSLSPQITGLLTGSVGTKKLFAERAIRELSRINPSPKSSSKVDEGHPSNTGEGSFRTSLQALSQAVDELENDDTSLSDVVPSIDSCKLEDHPSRGLVSTPIVSTADTPLARGLRSNGSIDWAVQGVDYLTEHNECPMCLRELSDPLRDAILGLSDAQYSSELEQLSSFEEFATRKLVGLELQIQSSRAILPETVQSLAAFEAVERSATAIREKISEKLHAPAAAVDLPNIDTAISALNEIVRTENNARNELRTKRESHKETRRKYANEAWELISHALAGQAQAFSALETELEQQISEQQGRINEALDSVVALKQELSDATSSIRTHRPWMDTVNELLENVGFRTFRFDESDVVEGAYTIVRADGSAANNTLSEGERTFVSFMYYVSSLSSVREGGEGRKQIAIIDDPIASLDSDVMFVVSALIKRLMLDIHKSRVNVGQLLLLTHNIHFLKEVSYARRGEESAERAFYVLNKTSTGTKVSARGHSNPVEVEYVRLWRQIGNWRDSHDSNTGLQNAMRRVIEFYFQTIGRVDERSLLAGFSGDEAIVAKSFFSWINEGSHSLFDGLHFAPTSATPDQYFKVFEEVFDKSGHRGHFAMMSADWS